MLKEAVPKAKRLAVLTNPGNPTRSLMLAGAEATRSPLGLQLQVLDAQGPGEFEAAFSAMRKGHADALLILVEPMLFGQRNRLVINLKTAKALGVTISPSLLLRADQVID